MRHGRGDATIESRDSTGLGPIKTVLIAGARGPPSRGTRKGPQRLKLSISRGLRRWISRRIARTLNCAVGVVTTRRHRLRGKGEPVFECSHRHAKAGIGPECTSSAPLSGVAAIPEPARLSGAPSERLIFSGTEDHADTSRIASCAATKLVLQSRNAAAVSRTGHDGTSNRKTSLRWGA